MDRGNIGKDSLKLTVSQMGGLFLGLVSAMILSRFRTLEEYGTYSQMYLIAGIISPIIMLGIPNSITYFIPRADNEVEKRKILSQNLILTIGLGMLVFLLIITLKKFLVSYFSNPMIGSMIIVIALFPMTRTINSTAEQLLVIYNKTSLFLYFKISHNALILLAVVITVALKLDFRIYMLIFISIELLFSFLVLLIAHYVSGGLIFYFNMDLFKKILAYSVPIGLSGTIGSINRHIDEMVIGRFFSTEDLAIYSNAARELPLKLLGISIATALLPRLILLVKEKNVNAAISLWKESIKLSYVFMCFFTAVLIVYAPEIISILYSEKYLPGVTVFRIYSVIMLFSVTYFYMIISCMGKTKYILYSTLTAIATNLVLSIIFYKLMGFIGPAVATLASFFIFRLVQLLMSVKLSGVRLRDIFPWISLLGITIVNIAFGLSFILIGRVIKLENLIGQIPESIILGGIWLVSYLLLFLKYIKSKWDILNKGSIE